MKPLDSTRGRHYSYEVYADPRTAESFDHQRFGGPIGAIVAEAQEKLLVDWVLRDPGGSSRISKVLDVGTGTGRAALVLARGGARVTGVDASAEMLRIARQRLAGLDVELTLGDAHALAFGDRAFDAAVCLRVLMHTPGWHMALGELCRVSRTRVVFDYPAAVSAAALQALARRAAHALGSRVEAYRTFTDLTIDRALAQHGFRAVARHRLFALPIALHKTIGSRAFTQGAEALLARLGVRWLIGSPVTVLAERDSL